MQGGWRIQISPAEFMNDWDQRGTWTDVCAPLRPCRPSRIPSDDTGVLKQRERDRDWQRDDTKCQEEPQSPSLYSAGTSLWRRFLREEARLLHFFSFLEVIERFFPFHRHHKYTALSENGATAKQSKGLCYRSKMQLIKCQETAWWFLIKNASSVSTLAR